MLKKKLTVEWCALVFVVAMCGMAFAGGEKTMNIDRFIDPSACADCHGEIYEQWQNSMHHQAHRDPIYTRVAAFLRKGLTDAGEIQEAESCVKCHTPVGYITGFPEKVSDNLSETPEIATHGIQCDYCHSVTDIRKIHNNGLVVVPGHGEDDPGIKYGPFDDAEPDFHDAAFSKLHTDSKICGTCHNVKHVAFGTDLETTYTEWENSSWNSEDPAKRVSCQGCHMYQRPGIPATGTTQRPANPGAATDYSKERPHIFTHYFVGANAGVPEQFGDSQKSKMAVERLKNAATLSLEMTDSAKQKINVVVANTGAGHSLPTGLTDFRQMWLEIVVTDSSEKIIFKSGVVGENGLLPSDARIFHTVFGDGKGNAVLNISKAREILKDNRVKAGESITETFSLPGNPGQGGRITARLLYRSAARKVLNLLPGAPIKPLPIIEMARVVKTL